MKKKLLCLLLAVLMLITVVAAAEKPKTSVDTFRRCSLTLQYAASGQTVRLYRVARISHSGNHTLQGVFAGYGIHLPAGNSQAEWDALRDTLHAYILADAIAPDYTATTGTDGKAVCAGLPVGMYLVDGVDMEVGSEVYQYAAALLSVPGADTLSGWTYDVTAAPKHTAKPAGGGGTVTPVTYTVVKLWANEKNNKNRPASVEITIYKNGIEQEKQLLSSANDWKYQWTATDGTWSVLERTVPKNYNVTVQRSGSSFFVTNTKNSPTPTPTPTPDLTPDFRPNTGDESHLMLYIILMAGSGLALLLIGVMNRKQKHETE